MTYIVGVDIGGTFTDVSVIDRSNRREVVAKAPTTPHDLLQGLTDALGRAADHLGLGLRDLLRSCERFSHATTQTTNVMFTWRGGSTVGLLTTRGFADELLIMRARGRVAGKGLVERRHLRATDKPLQIVPRERIAEVAERVDRSGRVLEPLDREQVRAEVRRLLGQGVDTFAVSLLWSHQNPSHEEAVREVIHEEAPGAHVSLSSSIAPLTGEYERTSTAVVNAYVAPTLERYLERLEDRLSSEGLQVPILVFQAGGGVSDIASTLPVATIESGPAAGMVAVQKLSQVIGQPDIIATDVGGTTFKVGLLVDGRWSMASETVINQYALLSPMIDIASIGAGGGSIAWVDSGRLRIGPESAGAAPGPACYGWGGERPTVTDADALLGYLSPDRPLSGQVALRLDLAEKAMGAHVAEPLFDGDVTAAAAGVRRVVDAQMGDLIRKATLERGFDPRRFILAAYGGAGPVHAASYARAAGVRNILVPLSATAFSAFGAVLSDAVRTVQRSVPPEVASHDGRLNQLYADVTDTAVTALTAQGIAEDNVQVLRWADMRYERQLHDVRVLLPGPAPEGGLLEHMAHAFAERYAELFGTTATLADSAPRVLRIGVDAVASSGVMPHFADEVGVDGAPAPVLSHRDVYWPETGEWMSTAVHDGDSLDVGTVLAGPAVVEQPGTTIVIPPEATAVVDRARNLLISLTNDGERA